MFLTKGSSAMAARIDLRGMTNQLWPLARMGALALLVTKAIRSLAASRLGANFGTPKPQPPYQVLEPAGPAGGRAMAALPSLYQSLLPVTTPQKYGHWRMMATRS